MKIWSGVCGLLSAGLLTMFLVVMESCVNTYKVGARGELLRVESDSSTVHREVSWDNLSRFESVQSRVSPGDILVFTERATGIPHTGVYWEMDTLEVLRGDIRQAVYHDGYLRFWGLTALVSAAPLLLWSVAALIVVTCSPRKGRAPPG